MHEIRGLSGSFPVLNRFEYTPRPTSETQWAKVSRRAPGRRVATQADKGKTASYKGSEEEGLAGKLKEEWKARFVTGDESPNREEKVEATPEDPYEAALSKEKFWGRIAVIGLGAVLLSERLSGKGIVTALNMATGVPVWEIEPALGLLVGAFLAAGIYPIVRRLGARADAAREAAASQNPAPATPAEPARKWGDSFQVATGRLAFITLAGTVLAEATTGKGILALLNVETGVEISEIEAGLTFLLLLLFTEDLQAPKP